MQNAIARSLKSFQIKLYSLSIFIPQLKLAEIIQSVLNKFYFQTFLDSRIEIIRKTDIKKNTRLTCTDTHRHDATISVLQGKFAKSAQKFVRASDETSR